MTRYFFEISFLGSNYSGWQRQKTAPSIQQTIEDVFETMLQCKVRIHGCGRTDAGVHASQYFFHIDLDSIPSNLKFKLNRMLPKDIAILKITQVDKRSNAQKNAISRTYEYRISRLESPFTNPYTALVFDNLDFRKMNKALDLILGIHDFANFCKRPNLMDNTKCNIFSASSIFNEESQTIIIKISGNRFLHHMMRLLIGNLIKVGNGHFSLEEFKDFIDLKKTPKYFELAPAQGLSLTNVNYI